MRLPGGFGSSIPFGFGEDVLGVDFGQEFIAKGFASGLRQLPGVMPGSRRVAADAPTPGEVVNVNLVGDRASGGHRKNAPFESPPERLHVAVTSKGASIRQIL